MMPFDRMPFAQLTLIGAACVLLAGCPLNGSSPVAGTLAATAKSEPWNGGTATITSKTPPTSGSPAAATTTSKTPPTSGSPAAATTTSKTPPTSGSPSAATNKVTLSWVAPTLNTDGSILNDLAGYIINYGTNATALTRSVSVTGATSTTDTITNLAPGTYYFSVTAYSSQDTQSAPSRTVSTTI